ncbi:HIRA-interacting protein 3 [Thoreauomyces humboldtii]|nr:HIRA-interacting protein 3 [Thoreauomyces humboldtii]
MSKPNLEETILEILRDCDLDKVTERQVRRETEKRVGLPIQSLDKANQKSFVKQCVETFLNAVSGPGTSDTPPQRPTRKRKAESRKIVESDDSSDSKHTSPAVDASESDDASEPPSPTLREPTPPQEKPATKDIELELAEADRDASPAPPSPSDRGKKPSGRTKPKRRRILASDEEDAENQSEGESSKEIKPPTSAKMAVRSKEKAVGNKESAAISAKHQTAIDGLKKYVSMCGVKKQWAKEFDGLDGPTRIKRVKAILTDLGIADRPTKEKCQRVKAKREWKQEVMDLDPSNVVSAKRRSGAR